MTTKRENPMHMGLFLKATGHHVAAWHHPGVDLNATTSVDHYVTIAKEAEQSGFDFIFFADSSAIREGKADEICRYSQFTAYLEPITLLSAIASQTSRIGLVATATTSYNQPFQVARQFASLDHISKGRAGWNVVTSGNASEAQNFGRAVHFAHAERYDRAQEFLDVVRGLWDSWDDDAFIHDRDRGLFFDPDALHVLDHNGKHFDVRGPLNVARSPQGHSVIFQAGSSGVGRDLAARTAEGVFCAPLTIEEAREFYADVKARAAGFGRSPDELVILPGVTVVVGATEQEAAEKDRYLDSLVREDVGIGMLEELLGMDLSGCGAQDPLPDRPSTRSEMGVFQSITKLARTTNMNLGDIYRMLAGSYGKLKIVGSLDQVVSTMSDWYHSHACDGFILQPAVLPHDMDDINRLLVPALRDASLIRDGYQGTTLREHLGLKRPASRYAVQLQTA